MPSDVGQGLFDYGDEAVVDGRGHRLAGVAQSDGAGGKLIDKRTMTSLLYPTRETGST